MTDLKECSNNQLETMWQASADTIGMYAVKSWHVDTPEEEMKYRRLAEKAQEEQQEIQKEITRRH